MSRRAPLPTIQAIDEPESTIYVLTRTDGSQLCHAWPEPLLAIEPTASWLPTPESTSNGIGSYIGISEYTRVYEGTEGQHSQRESNLPGLPGQVQLGCSNGFLQDLRANGISLEGGTTSNSEVGSSEWTLEAEGIDIQSQA